jgi:hypothetical protein
MYRIPRSTVVAVGAYSAVWVGFVIVGSLQETPASLVFLVFGLIPLGFLFVFTQVTLADEGSCEFRSVARRRRIRAQRITAISTDEAAIYVHHDRGKIHMWETDNFDDLLSRLLELNPAIELRGWVRQEHDATALP